jgi:hypothetical protein
MNVLSPARIVGIVLVRNEDLFVERAVRNIAAFCDSMILCEHESTDGTLGILQKLVLELPHAELHRIKHPSESHDLLKPFAGTRTWIFAVDGDEIYDPTLLKGFRHRLLAGEFDAFWRMKGNVLHCTSITPDLTVASGFMSPPSRSMTKLYNFAAITAWNGRILERLHGGEISFKEGFHDLLKNNFHESLGWEETPLRCLHLCFLRRSSQEAPAFREGHRENIQEIYGGGRMGKIRRFVTKLTQKGRLSRWKQEYYRRGPIETVDATPFFEE